MKPYFIPLLIIAVAIILRALSIFRSKQPGEKRATTEVGPQIELVDNDKLIVVKGVQYADIKKAVQDFCNTYNTSGNSFVLRSTQISPDIFSITFPFDIDIPGFCFAINYLKYPRDIKWDADVRAWCTTKRSDEWITEESAEKKVMLFVAIDDTEYDNVFLTTWDNFGFKLSFAGRKNARLLSVPKEIYKEPYIKLADIQNKEYEDTQ